MSITVWLLEMRTAEGHPTTPIGLCPESFEPQGRDCTVSGWGHLKSKGSGVPDMLREVQVKVLHDSICQKMLAGYPWDPKTETMLCAGGADKVRRNLFIKSSSLDIFIFCYRMRVKETQEAPWCARMTQETGVWQELSVGGWAVPRRGYLGSTPM